MLNMGTGNLHDGSSWVVSHHSTVLKWRWVFRRYHGDLIGLGRRQVVTYKTKMVVTYRTEKERRGTENRTKAWVGIYLYAQNPNIAKIPTCTHHISINPNLASTHFPVSNPKFKKQGRPLFQVLLYKGGTLLPGTPIQSGIFPSCTAVSDHRARVLGRRQTTLRRTCAGGSASAFLSGALIRLVDLG